MKATKIDPGVLGGGQQSTGVAPGPINAGIGTPLPLPVSQSSTGKPQG